MTTAHAHTCDVCDGIGRKLLGNVDTERWPRDWWVDESGHFVADCWDCRGTGIVECDDDECESEKWQPWDEWPLCDEEVA